MTIAPTILELAVEGYIRDLKWSAETPDEHRTLVIGNIRGFFSWLQSQNVDSAAAAQAAKGAEMLRAGEVPPHLEFPSEGRPALMETACPVCQRGPVVYLGDAGLAQLNEPDPYVAWLRYNNHNGRRPTTIHVCDSDAPGAFKVYRRPEQFK
jgi:hypothetical protein